MSKKPLTTETKLVSLTSVLPEDEKSANSGTDSWVEPRPVKYSPVMLTMAKTMFSSKTTYKVRLTRTATITTSGAGTLALVTLLNFSQYDQYTQISSLFEEGRLLKTSIHYAPLVSPNDTSKTPCVWALALDPSASSGATTSFVLVTRLPGAKFFGSTQSNWPVRASYKYGVQPWSKIGYTPGGTDPVGNLGGWCIANSAAGSASTAYLQYTIETIAEFRKLY